MDNRISLFCLAVALTSIAALSTTALAAGKGKPFIALDNQIITVTGITTDIQDQIDGLVARVDTIEDRVGANETAIADLEANSIYLGAMISANATSVADIEGEIAMLQQDVSVLRWDIADLQNQANAATVDIAVLEAELAADEALIASLQGALLALEQGSIAADGDLQQQIDTNASMIGALQSEIQLINNSLALKQNITQGVCPSGQAVIAVGNGSITCDATPAGLTSVTQYRMVSSIPVAANALGALNIDCPVGFLATGGGGGFTPTGLHWTSSRAQSAGYQTNAQGWFTVNLPAPYASNLFAHVTCLRFNSN